MFNFGGSLGAVIDGGKAQRQYAHYIRRREDDNWAAAMLHHKPYIRCIEWVKDGPPLLWVRTNIPAVKRKGQT